METGKLPKSNNCRSSVLLKLGDERTNECGSEVKCQASSMYPVYQPLCHARAASRAVPSYEVLMTTLNSIRTVITSCVT